MKKTLWNEQNKNELVKKSEAGSLQRPIKETNVWQMWWRKSKTQIGSGMKKKHNCRYRRT